MPRRTSRDRSLKGTGGVRTRRVTSVARALQMC